MANEECAKLLIELHSGYQELVGKYGMSVESKYAEAGIIDKAFGAKMDGDGNG